MKKSAGFTLIELLIVMTIIAVFIAAFSPTVFQKIDEAKVEGAVGQAREVLRTCDIVRVSPLSSVRGADGVHVTHTYRAGYADWTDAAVLATQIKGDHAIPAENPFGYPYLFKMSERECTVGIKLGFELEAWGGLAIETYDDTSLLVVPDYRRDTRTTNWARRQKQFLDGEVFR